MIWTAVLFSLAAQLAPTPPATPTTERLRLLVLDFSAESDVPAGLVSSVGSLVSAELATYPELDVIANADMRRMVELEGARQQSGCSDASCLAEIAGALGARLVVFGSVGKLGTATVVNLNLFDSVTAQSTGREFVQVKDPSELPRVLPGRVRSLLKRTYAEASLALPAEQLISAEVPAPASAERGPLPAILLASGVGGVVVGGVLAGVGLWPMFAYGGNVEEFKALDPNESGSAARAKALRTEAAYNEYQWETWALPLAAGGGLMLVAGVVSAVVGSSMLVSGEN